MLTIALDYDGTFDRLPAVWGRFIRDCRKHDCRVLIVSARRCECDADLKCENHEDVAAAVSHAVGSNVSVILTGNSPKRWFLDQRGIVVDIWIDDLPEAIIGGR